MTAHLLVIGAQRCGTTALHSLLEAHPEIAMARPSRPEPKVFLDAEKSARGARWYREHYFAHARGERLLGDKSTSYLEHPEAARRAAAVLGRAHVLVLLRDPVERAISNWRFSSRHGLEIRPLEVALSENLEGPRAWERASTSVSPFAYLERGRYADYLPAWAEAFPGSVHVRFLRELVEDETAVPDLWRTLGVRPDVGPRRLEIVENESDGDPPALSASLRGRLEEYYANSNATLSARLGRSLPW
jgi:hypothetical protein